VTQACLRMAGTFLMLDTFTGASKTFSGHQLFQSYSQWSKSETAAHFLNWSAPLG
jgi:hypothetical protein